jgi:hypothetical protein
MRDFRRRSMRRDDAAIPTPLALQGPREGCRGRSDVVLDVVVLDR